ncbi:hypothetical protein OIU78_024907 [Salix suchowensis]|nr:hypothetical protein OIU78_024907 [Salix suchowensis]
MNSLKLSLTYTARPLASSSLYKVKLGNIVYVVKRLKKLQVSVEEFGQKLRQIGNLKHPNILPQVGYINSTDEENF